MITTVHRQFDGMIAAAKKTLQMPEDPFGLKEGAKQVIADAAKSRDSISARFQEELKENEADKTLDSPAIVDGIEKTRFFESPNVFTTEEKGGQALVTVNPNYIRKDLPPFVPQLIVVDWVCSFNTPTEYYRKRVEANLPIEKFQALIDK